MKVGRVFNKIIFFTFKVSRKMIKSGRFGVNSGIF